MNIFRILKNDKVEKLEVKIYERVTSRKFPYFQENNGKMQHYAVCPACNNPIQIINLYVESHIDRKKDKQPLYAKHVLFDVTDVALYNQESYDSCPLANPSIITPTAKRPAGSSTSQEIKNLIHDYYYIVYDLICSIIGIQITESLFETMVINFSKEQGYAYKGVNKFNLPYAFLYMSNNTNILFQPLRKNNKVASLIKDKINEKCTNVIVKDDFISLKDKNITTKLEMYFSDHKISKNEEKMESMDLVLKENVADKESKEILVYNIEFDQKDFFVNIINKNKRLKKIVTDKLQ